MAYALRLLLKIAGDPGAFRALDERRYVWLVSSQRPVIEIGRVLEVPGDAVGVHLDVEHPLGDDPALAGAGDAGVLDGVLQIEQHAGSVPASRSSTSTAPRRSRSRCRSSDEIDRRIEQRMAGTDECRQRLALWRNQRLLEGDALVSRQHRLADADQAVTIAHRRGNVRHLVAARLALLRTTPPRRLNASRKKDSM